MKQALEQARAAVAAIPATNEAASARAKALQLIDDAIDDAAHEEESYRAENRELRRMVMGIPDLVSAQCCDIKAAYERLLINGPSPVILQLEDAECERIRAAVAAMPKGQPWDDEPDYTPKEYEVMG